MESDEKVLFEAGSIWKFLDTLAATNPAEYKRYVDKILRDGAANDMGPPVPRFSVETHKKPEVIPVRKYLVNIAEWKQIPKQKTKSAPIPILASECRREVVEKEWASVIDVVINPAVFNNYTNELELASLIELVLKYIEEKNGFQLSRRYQVLEEKYKGNEDNLLNFMCPSKLKKSLDQAINSDLSKESVVEAMKKLSSNGQVNNVVKKSDLKRDILNGMVDSKRSSPLSCDQLIMTPSIKEDAITEVKQKLLEKESDSKLKTPKVEMELDKETGSLELKIYLPDVESVQECDLEMTENRLALTAFEKYHVDLELPVNVVADKTKAKFVKDRKILLIKAIVNSL